MDYSIYRTCERFGILPPRARTHWDDIDFWTQGRLLSYEEIRSYEENELLKAQSGTL